MLRIESISRDWKDFSLKYIDLNIREGEYFIILGPTGSGKTLLLELLMGFHPPDGGTVRLNGEDITMLSPTKRGFGFVYQDYMLFPHMTVRENIAYGLKIQKKKNIDEKVRKTAETVGVEHLLQREPVTLSGGEEQRVALARALILEPDILLLDEPFGSLDYQTSIKLRELVKDIHADLGNTIIHVTHNQEEAVVMGERVAVMKGGGMIQTGRPHEIMRRPNSKFVAEFVGTGNIFHGTARKDGDVSVVHIEGIDIYCTADIQGDVTLTLRPEDIILAAHKIESSARNNFRGKVKKITDRGIYHEITIDIGLQLVVYVTRQSIENLDLKVGKDIWTMFKASAVHVFKE